MFRTLIARNIRSGARAFSTRGPVRPYIFSRGAMAVGGAALLMVPFGFISNDDQVKQETKLAEDVSSEVSGTKAEEPSPEDVPKTEEAEPSAEDYEGAAYNPITGEINWECPCLGGMAHGPCGEEFKEAFACFVYSETEPKGIDCIKKFEAMRTCFRRYPEHYKEQLFDDEEEEAQEAVPPSTSLASTSEIVIETASVDTVATEDAEGAFDAPEVVDKHHETQSEAAAEPAPPTDSSTSPAN